MRREDRLPVIGCFHQPLTEADHEDVTTLFFKGESPIGDCDKLRPAGTRRCHKGWLIFEKLFIECRLRMATSPAKDPNIATACCEDSSGEGTVMNKRVNDLSQELEYSFEEK